jgi:hypothetical protein
MKSEDQPGSSTRKAETDRQALEDATGPAGEGGSATQREHGSSGREPCPHPGRRSRAKPGILEACGGPKAKTFRRGGRRALRCASARGHRPEAWAQ